VIAAWAGVHAYTTPLGVGKALEKLVIEGNEVVKDGATRVQLEGKPSLGEVELDDVGTRVKRAADIGLGLVEEVGQKGLAPVAGQAVGRVEQAQRRWRDDRLLDRNRRVLERGPQLGRGVYR